MGTVADARASLQKATAQLSPSNAAACATALESLDAWVWAKIAYLTCEDAEAEQLKTESIFAMLRHEWVLDTVCSDPGSRLLDLRRDVLDAFLRQRELFIHAVLAQVVAKR